MKDPFQYSLWLFEIVVHFFVTNIIQVEQVGSLLQNRSFLRGYLSSLNVAYSLAKLTYLQKKFALCPVWLKIYLGP